MMRTKKRSTRKRKLKLRRLLKAFKADWLLLLRLLLQELV